MTELSRLPFDLGHSRQIATMTLRANPSTAASDRPLLRTFLCLLTRTTSATTASVRPLSLYRSGVVLTPTLLLLVRLRGVRSLGRRFYGWDPRGEGRNDAPMLSQLLGADIELRAQVGDL